MKLYEIKTNEQYNSLEIYFTEKPEEADRIDLFYYPNDAEYRGNIYKDSKPIGDYVTGNSAELENSFPQLVFNW